MTGLVVRLGRGRTVVVNSELPRSATAANGASRWIGRFRPEAARVSSGEAARGRVRRGPFRSQKENVRTGRKAPAIALAALVLLGAFVLSLRTAAAADNPTQDPASFWNHLTTHFAQAAHLSHPRLARAYALVHVAIYDGLLASGRTHDGDPSQVAVAAGAASEVLTYLFPNNAGAIAENETARAASVQAQNPGVVVSGLNFGHMVGRMVVVHGQNDGSDAVFTGPIPTGPCIWTGVNPVEPTAGSWKTWIETSGAEVQPLAPYACGSQADLNDIQTELAAQAALTQDQIATVHEWAVPLAPTIWDNVAISRISSGGLSVFQSARILAYLNIGMYDGLVSTWLAKYTFWSARPFMRIPGFTTVIPTPNFPGYISAHATVSGVASVVLGEIFPVFADYFGSQANEAAMSRLWGGIHFPQDDDQGLVVGRAIGALVVEDMMGPAHTFVFPIAMAGLAVG